MDDFVLVLGAVATLLFGLSVMAGRVTLIVMRGGLADQETGLRHWGAVLAFPAQVAIIVWIFVYLPWYFAAGSVLLGLFFFGAVVNRANLGAFYVAQPALNAVSIAGSVILWALMVA